MKSFISSKKNIRLGNFQIHKHSDYKDYHLTFLEPNWEHSVMRVNIMSARFWVSTVHIYIFLFPKDDAK